MDNTQPKGTAASKQGTPRPDRSDRRYFFIHCLKTGGTTLYFQLKQIFGEQAFYPASSDKGNINAVMTMEFLEKRMQSSAGDGIRMVTGHFPCCTRELLGAEFKTLTVLREPVARTLSYLRHHRANSPEDQHKSLEEIYNDPLRFHGMIHNHMVKMFCLDISDKKTGMLTHINFTREHLEAAKHTLETIDTVGVLEDYEAFCKNLKDAYGWDISAKVHANRTDASEPVSDAFRQRIAEDNALDTEFYQFALNLIERRH